VIPFYFKTEFNPTQAAEEWFIYFHPGTATSNSNAEQQQLLNSSNAKFSHKEKISMIPQPD
jgi:hypothetical protein